MLCEQPQSSVFSASYCHKFCCKLPVFWSSWILFVPRTLIFSGKSIHADDIGPIHTDLFIFICFLSICFWVTYTMHCFWFWIWSIEFNKRMTLLNGGVFAPKIFIPVSEHYKCDCYYAFLLLHINHNDCSLSLTCFFCISDLMMRRLIWQWFAGALLIVVGSFVLSKSSIEKKAHTH